MGEMGTDWRKDDVDDNNNKVEAKGSSGVGRARRGW